MGYTTEFHGQFDLQTPLTEAQAAYLKAFADTRRMQRDAFRAAKLKDPLREAVGLPIGPDGGYYVGNEGEDFLGRTSKNAGDGGVVDYNQPPTGQPGLWCQWAPSEDRTAIEWDGGEKFYYYIDWIKYLIEHFLKPWGHVLNGDVQWIGEDADDRGMIRITNNVVSVGKPNVTYTFEEV